jgi:energy-coupling factor transport system permease protein
MSVIYKLDPRIKILFVFLFTVMIFLVDKLPLAAAMLASFLVLRIAGKVYFGSIKTIGFLSLLVVFIVLMQIFFGPGETYIIMPFLGGKFTLKWEGLILGITLGCRLAALMLLLPMLTLTTSPYSIATGLTALGVNYRAAFIITTAFNLIPLFEEDARAIMDAQKLRGMRSFEKGTLLSKLKAYPALVVPLVLGAMRKAQVSSVAMDSRAFGVFKRRTWLEKPAMKVHDYICTAICGVFFILVILLNYFYF